MILITNLAHDLILTKIENFKGSDREAEAVQGSREEITSVQYSVQYMVKAIILHEATIMRLLHDPYFHKVFHGVVFSLESGWEIAKSIIYSTILLGKWEITCSIFQTDFSAVL